MFRFYLRLAMKNLWRHKRRTILTVSAIAAGISAFIIIDALLIGADRDAAMSLIDYQTGYAQVVSAKEDRDRPVPLKDLLLPGADRLTGLASALPGVQGATPRLLFPATLTNGSDEIPVTGVGVDPAGDGKVFRVNTSIKTGRWLHPDENGAVLGQRLAALLDLRVGDTVTVRMQTSAMAFQALDLTIVGLAMTPNPTVNQEQILLPLGTARNALATGNAATAVAVRVIPGASLDAVAREVSRLPYTAASFRVKTWLADASFMAIGSAKQKYSSVLLFMIFVISTIGIVNTVLLAALERVREIALFKAMGMRERGIISLFVYEGLGLGLLGGLLGVVLAVAVNAYFVNVGIDFAAIMGNTDIDIGYPLTRMRAAWHWGIMPWTVFFGLAASLLASYFPARKAARLDPVEGLRRA